MHNIFRFVTLASVCVALCATFGCGGNDIPSTPRVDTKKAPWRVTFNHHAVTLSTTVPHNTIQLTSVVYNVDGDILTDEIPVELIVADASVQVTESGLVTALLPQTGVQIIAVARYENVTVRDTVVINITDDPNPPSTAHVLLAPQPGDTPILQMSLFGSDKMLQVAVLGPGDTPIPNAALRLWSSDSTVVKVTPLGMISPGAQRRPGEVYIYAEGTVYGIQVKDSLHVRVTCSDIAMVGIEFRKLSPHDPPVGAFLPDSVVICAMGGVLWQNITPYPVDITFNQPEAAEEWMFFPSGSGNISAFQPDSVVSEPSIYRSRAFSQPGVYTYRSPLHGMEGKIVVVTP